MANMICIIYWMKDIIPPSWSAATLALWVTNVDTSRIAPKIANCEIMVKAGVIVENVYPTAKLWPSSSSDSLSKALAWLSSWTKDFTTRAPRKLSLAMPLMRSINVWNAAKCGPMRPMEIPVTMTINTTITTMIHHSFGMVMILKINAPTNNNGTRINTWNTIINNIWIWLISLVIRTTRLSALNFSTSS